jgi:hypothetical protein
MKGLEFMIFLKQQIQGRSASAECDAPVAFQNRDYAAEMKGKRASHADDGGRMVRGEI